MITKNYEEHPPSDQDQPSINKNSISHEEHSNFSGNPPYLPQKFKAKLKKKTGNTCFTLTLLKLNGNIHLFHHNQKVFVSRLSLIDFDDHFDELLEKGKSDLGNYFAKLQETRNIPDLTFWQQRYYYYSKFDEGIQMDLESWWSVTPEIIAEYTAKFALDSIVIDGFCGSGGNVIQFSKYSKKVYAIDIDQHKLDITRNNCRVYNCKNNIEFILSDFLLMENSGIQADYIFLSPPWGGVQYKESEVYCIKELMKPSIYDIIRVSLKIAKKIMFYFPRTLLMEELFEILSDILNKQRLGSGDRLFFDVHILKSAMKIKAMLIIFGNDINRNIVEEDLSEYLRFRYENITSKCLDVLNAIARIVGNYKFLQTECFIRQNYCCENTTDFPNGLINYFFTKILTEQEKIKLRSLNLYNPKKKETKSKQLKGSGCSQLILKANTWTLEPISEIHFQFLSKKSHSY